MSNIYIQEPPTSGKVILQTSVGPIDIELWSKETPKACRNFVQLALEGYYDGTIFHRVIKGMCVQGGDATGTGEGGESIYGKPFKDEIHSRLRFNRRGLVATASAEKNDNTSQFFFTFGPTPHLNGKHTIFGKVAGDTIFNMLKLEDGDVDEDDRPEYPQKIRSTEVVDNPFPDIVPRKKLEAEEPEKTKKPKKESGKKDFKLLSFGDEAEEEEEEVSEINEKQFKGKSKSSHDLLTDDRTLSSAPAVDVKSSSEKDKSSKSKDKSKANLDRVREKLDNSKKKSGSSRDEKSSKSKAKRNHGDSSGDERDVNVDNYFEEERRRKGKIEADEHRKEYKKLRKEMNESSKKKTEEAEKAANPKSTKHPAKDVGDNDLLASFHAAQDAYSELTTAKLKQAGQAKREAQTLALLAKFKTKKPVKEEAAEAASSDNCWGHEFRCDDQTPVLAKDATTQKEEMYDITDPRHPLNARKRERAGHGDRDRHRSRR